MNDTVKVLGEKALTTWGSLGALVLLAILGGWALRDYLIHKDQMEHKRFEARQVREATLTALVERQHEGIVNICAPRLSAIDKKLSRLDARGEAWEPTLKEMVQYMREMRRTAQEIQEDQQ